MKAISYYKCGSQKGGHNSSFALTELFENGIFADKNIAQALFYYRLAKEQGYKNIDEKIEHLNKLTEQ